MLKSLSRLGERRKEAVAGGWADWVPLGWAAEEGELVGKGKGERGETD